MLRWIAKITSNRLLQRNSAVIDHQLDGISSSSILSGDQVTGKSKPKITSPEAKSKVITKRTNPKVVKIKKLTDTAKIVATQLNTESDANCSIQSETTVISENALNEIDKKVPKLNVMRVKKKKVSKDELITDSDVIETEIKSKKTKAKKKLLPLTEDKNELLSESTLLSKTRVQSTKITKKSTNSDNKNDKIETKTSKTKVKQTEASGKTNNLTRVNNKSQKTEISKESALNSNEESATKTDKAESSAADKDVDCILTKDQVLLENIKAFPLYIVQQKNTGPVWDPSLWPFSPVLKQVQTSLRKEPGVTRILSDTMSEESRLALKKWEIKMTAKLGSAGFKKLKTDNFENGRNFHSCLEQHLQYGTDLSDLDLKHANDGLWTSIEPVLKHVSDVQLLETSVVHPLLGYMGIVDCLARYRDNLVLIDWKTSDRFKGKLEYTYDAPVQLVAYLAALNHSPMFDIKVNEALLVICYKDGRQAHTHYMSPPICKHYWRVWLERLHMFYEMKRKEEKPLVT